MESQFEKLATNPDMIIATPGVLLNPLIFTVIFSLFSSIPGRLRHLLAEVDTFSLKAVQMVVFDEGDRLFEMGFAEDIKVIMDMVRSIPFYQCFQHSKRHVTCRYLLRVRP